MMRLPEKRPARKWPTWTDPPLKLVALVVGEGDPADERGAAALEHEDLRWGRPAGASVEGEEDTAGLRGPGRPTRETPLARDDGVPHARGQSPGDEDAEPAGHARKL